MRHAKEEQACNSEQAIDLNSAVEELNGLSSQELSKLLRDSENFTLHRHTEKGLLVQIDMEKLASSLPMHLLAVLLSRDRGDIYLRYMLQGLRLLHSLCDLARQTRLEQILLDDVKIMEQILDLVFYMLIVLGSYGKEHATSFVPLLHSALVACSLHLLTGSISSQWQDVVHVLLAHPKVDVFMDVAFHAVRVDIRFLQIKLSAIDLHTLCRKSSPLPSEQTMKNLCHQCEASLQFIQSMCQQKMFRERLLKHKELCKNGGILSLAQAVLKLDIPPHLQESSTVVAAVSRMKSKVLSILVQLCETESISYLDEVASSPRSMQLAKSVALEVLELLKTVFGREPKQLGDCLDNSYPRGLVLLNSMRLTDIFSDDSNFRSFITLNITQVLVEIFSLPPEEFCSSWCSTDLPLTEEDAALEYDPFVAAGAILALPSTTFGTSLLASDPSNEAIKECPFILNNIPQASYAQQRTSFLVKIIANLHCFVPNICEEQERNLFFNKFLECLQTELPKTLPGFSLTHDTQKAATVCENLCSLLAHAKSLIPNLLNEEDVQLLSFFYKQLQSLITSAQVEAKPVQGQVQENKFGDLLHKFSNYRLNEHHQEVQGIGAARKLDPKIREVAPDLNDKSGSHKDDISDNSTFEDLYKFGMTGKGTDPPDDVMDPDGRRKDKNGIGKSASESFRETDKDLRTVEPSSSDGKNSFDQMMDNDDFPKLAEHAKESAFMGSQDNEKTETMQFEEKQRRKRKRNIMNDTQITLIERALLDEPEMQRNATLLQSWADKLSVHGSELTSSQLKNWVAFRYKHR
ncbi:PREDICTED: nodulin homeobox isoform X2 [Nelumbo nucifera]|uniref:Nodulin homeobox isoform X2 n=2 Tax=Nelumbo nucifera TaxID=4432 RepID=A0A1U7ZA72_NELNU|nr:PREDICTED: nodulin homeobox isoform X2 [Nelumbo nucifera]DAD37883.1 TPA_asm: hypothetical protein HUJ06_008524 [Nelumbo nucifera]